MRAHEIVPAETGFLYSFAASWEGFYDYMMGVLHAVDPGVVEQAQMGLAQVEAMIGAELRKDILPMIGPEVSLAVSWPHNGLIPDVALLVGLKDVSGFQKWCAGLQERFASELKAGSVEYMGHTINYFGPAQIPTIPGMSIRPQVRISMTVIDDFLVITPWPQVAKNLINGLKSGKPRLKDNPDFKSVLAKLNAGSNTTGNTWLMYVDVKALAGFVLDNAVPFIQSVVPDDLGIPVDIKWGMFPATSTITRHLEGVMAVGHIERDGLFAQYYSPTGVLFPQLLMTAGMGVLWMSNEVSEPQIIIRPDRESAPAG